VRLVAIPFCRLLPQLVVVQALMPQHLPLLLVALAAVALMNF
jgi:hypothetical protein